MMDAITSFADPPFATPPDVVLDLPAPISANVARKINWAAHKRLTDWKRGADAYVFAAKCRKVMPLKLVRIPRFELTVVLDEAFNDLDLDNSLKSLIDYLVYINLIENDAKKNMRALHVFWGVAPTGCRVTVRACE